MPPAPTPFPSEAPIQLATLVAEAPEGDEWLHEVKYDGYRLRLALQDGAARVLTRSGQDWTDRFPGIVAAVEALPVGSALLDGEAVVNDRRGVSDFSSLQDALSTGRTDAIRFEVFDVLYLDGRDLRAETLVRRKDVLADLLKDAPGHGPLRYVEHVAGHGPEYHAKACTLLLEGSVSKRADRPWVGGRTRDWLKVKCLARQEFVIGGWTDPAGQREGFGALLLGVHDSAGDLVYAGRVGTGFDERTLQGLRRRLDGLATADSPFVRPPRDRGVHWVRPGLVAEVVFREWTRDGLVRQGSFKGLREDKDPASVVREAPTAASPIDDPPATSHRPAAGAKLSGETRHGGATGSATASGAPAHDATRRAPGGIRVAGVTITNPDRVLEPAGVTKLELARYYERVAPWILPHVAGRLLTIVRCPRATEGSATCFYQKHPESRGWPKGLMPVEVQDKEGPAVYFFISDTAGLVSLAQLGTLEIHTWGSQANDPEHADRIIFDLDPGPGVSLRDVIDAARLVRGALDRLGLAAFVKTTGGHGLHVVTPIVPEQRFDEVRSFARSVVDLLVAQHPERLVGRMAKAERPGRVFIDYLRNAHGATAVAAYSTRARPGGSVSVPVTWDELGRVDPSAYDIRSVPARLARVRRDPWEGYAHAAAHLPRSI